MLQGIEQLISKSEKKVSLLKELLESIKYEQCEYHLDREEQYPNLYYLVKIESREILIAGRIDEIRSYISLRNIRKEKIYGQTLLEQKRDGTI